MYGNLPTCNFPKLLKIVESITENSRLKRIPILTKIEFSENYNRNFDFLKIQLWLMKIDT